MNRSSTALMLACLGIVAVCLTGCNLFDGMDSALHARSDLELTDEGNLALEAGDFAAAGERFNELLARGSLEDSTFRGKGETLAGQAGFRVLAVLDALQNGVGPYDKSTTCFRAARLVTDRLLLEQAIAWMNRIVIPDRPDRIARGLMKVVAAVRLLLDKYDTNRNRRLDQYDEIDFDTNDRITPTWPQLYKDLVIGPSPVNATLEQAFSDLAIGFDGKGASWTVVTPVIGQIYSGKYNDINRYTILAVGDLTERLKVANFYFDIHPASFSAAIQLLDGAE